jgi:hypothetical protein
VTHSWHYAMENRLGLGTASEIFAIGYARPNGRCGTVSKIRDQSENSLQMDRPFRPGRLARVEGSKPRGAAVAQPSCQEMAGAAAPVQGAASHLGGAQNPLGTPAAAWRARAALGGLDQSLARAVGSDGKQAAAGEGGAESGPGAPDGGAKAQ